MQTASPIEIEKHPALRTGISRNQIKQVRSLSRKKFRDESGLFLAEGEKMVREAIESGWHIRDIFRTREIGEENMSRITSLATPSPVLAVVEQPAPQSIDSVLREFERETDGAAGRPEPETLSAKRNDGGSRKPLFIALDGVRDPGNLGTILRLADWFGIDAVFASGDTVELFNPKTVQATMGAIFRKQAIYTSLPALIDRMLACGLPVYGTFLDGENIYGKNPDKRGLIVMGSESSGISDALRARIPSKLFIPPYPADARTSESLNVAIATAILCAEFRR